MSGQNALLSLLSQDDFQKLKQDIHTHIDKIGGKIEEIAASDEEDEREERSHKKNVLGDALSEDEDHLHEGGGLLCGDEDDDDVILTSVRGRRPGTGSKKVQNSSSRTNSNQHQTNKNRQSGVNQITDFDSQSNQMEDSPRQNTKFMKTPSVALDVIQQQQYRV